MEEPADSIWSWLANFIIADFWINDEAQRMFFAPFLRQFVSSIIILFLWHLN